MQLVLIVELFAALAYASAAELGTNIFIRQDIGCDLLPCATDDCDLLACGPAGWGVVSDCACCGGQVGCNIPLGHTCSTEGGEPVCLTGNTASAPSSSSAITPATPSSSSSSPAAASSSASGGDSGSTHASDNANKNAGAPSFGQPLGWDQPIGHFALFAFVGYVVNR